MQGRSIAAVLAGIVVGVVISLVFSKLIDAVYPEDFEVYRALKGDPELILEYLRNLPAGFHLLGIAGGLLRLIAGLITASMIDRANLMSALVVAIFFLLLTVLDVLMFPHPTWFGFVYIPSMIAITFAFVLAKRKV